MTIADSSLDQAAQDPIRRAPKKRRPLLDFALGAIALSSGVMLGLALPAIIEASSFWDYVKAATLAFSAAAVSYAINKSAIDRGSELGTTGFVGATLVSVGSILVVGSGLFAGTYAGLTLKDTGDLKLREHGEALGTYVADRSVVALKASRVAPAIRATEADLREKAACEAASSCISGHRSGGNGAVARVVQEHAGRAASIAQQVETGEASRGRIVERLHANLAAFKAGLDDDAIAASERRAKLQAAHARILQGAAELEAAAPLSLVAAYGDELQSGVSITGRSEAETRLNAILSRHGKSLAAVAASIEDASTPAPAFPGRPGVSETFHYILHFLPVAAIALVVELVLPLTLFAYAFWELAWSKDKKVEARKAAALPLAALEGPPEAIDPDPAMTTPPPEPARRGRPPSALRERGLGLRNGDARRGGQ